jgi:hypothetical protein
MMMLELELELVARAPLRLVNPPALPLELNLSVDTLPSTLHQILILKAALEVPSYPASRVNLRRARQRVGELTGGEELGVSYSSRMPIISSLSSWRLRFLYALFQQPGFIIFSLPLIHPLYITENPIVQAT